MNRLPVHHEIDHWAVHTPEQIAVHDGNRTLTYGELADHSSRLGQDLVGLGVQPQDRVLFCLARSVHCLTALLGILRTGAVYVPLDPKSPPPRARSIRDDCAPRAIICDPSSQALAEAVAGAEIPVICLGDGAPGPAGSSHGPRGLERTPAPPLSLGPAADELAYILYTSGSTGQPKGVMISHGNIRSYIDWAVRCFGITAADRILSTAPFHFDMSTFDVFCTLRSGASLYIASEALTLFPEKLVGFMERHQVTLWKGISSLLMYLARAGVLRPGRLPALRQILFGGEALAPRWLHQWMTTFPDKVFCNVYGPTEATGISLFDLIEEKPRDLQEPIPIGRPCDDTYLYLLDDALQPVADGEIGELFLGGRGLGQGYLKAPEKTALAFLPDPFRPGRRIYRSGDLARRRPDGRYVLVGRRDQQVKIMGYRVELGEIEHALAALPGVAEVAVAALPAGGQDLLELVAFIEGDLNPDTAAAFELLRQRLPFYMIPRRLLQVGKLPRCGRGKLDRQSLPLLNLSKEGCHDFGLSRG